MNENENENDCIHFSIRKQTGCDFWDLQFRKMIEGISKRVARKDIEDIEDFLTVRSRSRLFRHIRDCIHEEAMGRGRQRQ